MKSAQDRGEAGEWVLTRWLWLRRGWVGAGGRLCAGLWWVLLGPGACLCRNVVVGFSLGCAKARLVNQAGLWWWCLGQTVKPRARSCSRPSSVIFSGPHGGIQTQLIRKSLTRPPDVSATDVWSSMTSVSGQAADVSVMSIVAVLSCSTRMS